MDGLYGLLLTLHNLFGTLTLLLTLAAGGLLLATARTSSSASSLALRADVISASVQFLLGVLLVIVAIVIGNGGYIASLWFHYLLGIVTVGVVSAVAARARRAPDGEARRYGGILLGVVLLVLVTFLVGQFRYTLI